jgi:hypothetical protein
VFRAVFGITTIDLFTPGAVTGSSGFSQNFQEYQSNVTVQNAPGNPAPAFYLSQGPGNTAFTVLPNGTFTVRGHELQHAFSRAC